MRRACDFLISYSDILKKPHMRNLVLVCLILVAYKLETYAEAGEAWLCLIFIIIYGTLLCRTQNFKKEIYSVKFIKFSYIVCLITVLAIFTGNVVRGRGLSYFLRPVFVANDLFEVLLFFLILLSIFLSAQNTTAKAGIFNLTIAGSVSAITIILQFFKIQYAVTLPQLILLLILGNIMKTAFDNEMLTDKQVFKHLAGMGYIILIVTLTASLPFFAELTDYGLIAKNAGDRRLSLMTGMFYVLTLSCVFCSVSVQCQSINHLKNLAKKNRLTVALFSVIIGSIIFTAVGIQFIRVSDLSPAEILIFTLLCLTMLPVNAILNVIFN